MDISKYKSYEITNNTELNAWEAFVSENNGSYFQSVSFYNLCKKTPETDPYIFVIEYNQKIQTGVLVTVQRTGEGIKSFLSRRAIIIGGPVYGKDEISSDLITLLLKKLNSKIRNKAIYTEFRNQSDFSYFKNCFISEGYNYREHYNIKLPLIDELTLNTRMSSSKRRQIKKSIKSGVKIIDRVTLEQVKAFYLILTELYKTKVKKPLPSWSFFNEIYLESRKNNNIKFLLIEYKNEIVGGILTPIYNGVIYEWYIANKDVNEKHVYPGVMATWAGILYGQQQGMKVFDFMGAGKPDEDYGVREFKLKFGGDLVNFGRFQKINNHFLFQIGKLGLKFSELLRRA